MRGERLVLRACALPAAALPLAAAGAETAAAQSLGERFGAALNRGPGWAWRKVRGAGERGVQHRER